jgi:hypothetical protein
MLEYCCCSCFSFIQLNSFDVLFLTCQWILDYLCFKQTKLSEATNFQVCHSAVELINDLRAAHVPSVDAFAEEILMGLVTILRTEKLLKIRTAAWYGIVVVVFVFVC